MANFQPLPPDRENYPAGRRRDRFDLRVRLLQFYLMFAGGILLGLFFFMVFVRRRVTESSANNPILTVFDEAFVAGFVAFLGFLFLIAVIYWLLLSWLFMAPLEQLESFSGRVLWRGGLRPEEKEALEHLIKRPDQIGNVARSLLWMAQDTEQRLVQLSTLLETSRAIAASLDVPQVMDNILRQIQRLFEVDRAAIITLDRRAGVFRIQASRGMSAEYVDRLRIAPSDPNSPAMRALRQNQPIQVADTETDLSYEDKRALTRLYGHRSVLAIPLRTHHSPPTVLVLQKTNPYRYSYSELELAESFGHHASVSLENAALFGRSDEKLQEQTRRLEAIVESLADGLILAGLDDRVIFCNQQAVTMIGQNRSEVLNLRTDQIVADLVRRAPDAAEIQRQVSERPDELRSFEFTRSNQDRRQDIRLSIFDVTDARGQRIGQGQLWQDITRDRELDRMKSTLLSTVSHELRTPLATIKGYATTLLARDVHWDGAAQREFLETISKETDRLADLVKNLLDMSRIEANILEMDCHPYSLNALIDQVIESLGENERARVRRGLADQLPLVLIDLPRIETVVRNLLQNGLKYSPAASPVHIATQQQNGQVVCAITDHGIGVPAGIQDKIFDPFYRADDRLARQDGGVGLGLAICKGFIEAHDGRIWVTSSNEGTTFGFALPGSDQIDLVEVDSEQAPAPQ